MVLGSLGSRSRFGCMTCRRKHRKCDEQRPVCRLCESGGLECSYQSTLKWADSHNISTFNASLRQKGKVSKRAANSAARRCTVSTSSLAQDPQAGNSRDLDLQSSPEGPIPSFASLPRHSARTREDAQGGLYSRVEYPIAIESDRWEESDDDASKADLDGYDVRGDDDPNVADHTWVVDNTISNLLFQTSLAPDEEIAFMYYFKRVCTCIPAYDSPSNNPYRKLALISLSHPVLLHGILSVSTGHMHNYGRSNDAILSARQARALNSLQAALGALLTHKPGQGASMSVEMRPFVDTTGVFSLLSARELALAAIMMQTSSVLMTGIGSVEVHIKCALEFIRDLGWLYQPASSIFGRLLVHRFAMVDVVLAHFRFRRPLAPIDFFMYRDDDKDERMDREEPSFREMQGCEQRVLCFLAQIACLSAELADFPSLDGEIQIKGYELETEMRVWGRRYHNAMAQGGIGVTSLSSGSALADPSSGSGSGSEEDQRRCLDVVCECIYWTAHILLLRRVFLDPTRSARVQLIRKHVFRLMDSLQAGCGPDSSLPFPFYMAAREAITPEDRDWVRRKHAAMMEAYRDRSREYLMAATERMWEKEAETADVGQSTLGGTQLLDTEYERFIRVTDKQASYFMF